MTNLNPQDHLIPDIGPARLLDLFEKSGRVNALLTQGAKAPVFRFWTPEEITEGVYGMKEGEDQYPHLAIRRIVAFSGGATIISYISNGDMPIEREEALIKMMLDQVANAAKREKRNIAHFFAPTVPFEIGDDLGSRLENIRIRAKIGETYTWLRLWLDTSITAIAPDFRSGALWAAGAGGSDGRQRILMINGASGRVENKLDVDQPIISMALHDGRLIFIGYDRAGKTRAFILNLKDGTQQAVESAGSEVVRVEVFRDRVFLATQIQILKLDMETMRVIPFMSDRQDASSADQAKERPFMGFIPATGHTVFAGGQGGFTIGSSIQGLAG